MSRSMGSSGQKYFEAQTRRRVLKRILLVSALGLAASHGPAKGELDQGPANLSDQIDVSLGFVRVSILESKQEPRPEEFEVRWEGQRQQVVRVVGGTDGSLEVGIAVDQSSSMAGALEYMRAEAVNFVESRFSDQDRVFVVAFADKMEVVAQGKAESLTALKKIPSQLDSGDQTTAFFSSLDRALHRFENSASKAALVVISDGCDSRDLGTGAASVSGKAADMAIPIFLLSPGRGQCKNASCAMTRSGRWVCSAGGPPSIAQYKSDQIVIDPTARTLELSRESASNRSTNERDRFLGLIQNEGGAYFAARSTEQSRKAFESVRELLAQQWTIVFEPTSSDVKSADVKVYRTVDGHRRRLR
ncbi:MAG: VWA domain-containing protein [Thermoanaerobaculia bacterium]